MYLKKSIIYSDLIECKILLETIFIMKTKCVDAHVCIEITTYYDQHNVSMPPQILC